MVAEQAGRVVGFGTYRWSQRLTAPLVKFWIGHLVSNSHQAAIQEQICHALEDKAIALGQSAVYAIVREDNLKRLEIYQRRGYLEEMRSFGARLDVQHFDARPYAGHLRRLQESGVEVNTLGELEEQVTDKMSLYARLFDVYAQTALDAPDVGGSGVATIDDYVSQNLAAKRTIPSAYFVAVRGEEYIGLSELFSTPSPHIFDTGTTVVKRQHRRLGVGLGLKLRAIAYAQAHDGNVIQTGFAADNHASVNLNLKLGFICEPSWITLRKSLMTVPLCA
jgi:L-amino acid N-acyltransferase YncA